MRARPHRGDWRVTMPGAEPGAATARRAVAQARVSDRALRRVRALPDDAWNRDRRRPGAQHHAHGRVLRRRACPRTATATIGRPRGDASEWRLENAGSHVQAACARLHSGARQPAQVRHGRVPDAAGEQPHDQRDRRPAPSRRRARSDHAPPRPGDASRRPGAVRRSVAALSRSPAPSARERAGRRCASAASREVPSALVSSSSRCDRRLAHRHPAARAPAFSSAAVRPARPGPPAAWLVSRSQTRSARAARSAAAISPRRRSVPAAAFRARARRSRAAAAGTPRGSGGGASCTWRRPSSTADPCANGGSPASIS